MIFCGIDCGTETLKIVLHVNGSLQWLVLPYESQFEPSFVEEVSYNFFKNQGIKISDIRNTVATGSGRKLVTFAKKTLPEIFCLAKAVEKFFPDAGVAIDIGARSFNIIRCKRGRILKFITNNRCAAGAGISLKILSDILEVSLKELDDLYFLSQTPCYIHSACAVFMESEVISFLHQGKKVEDIIKGAILNFAGKIATLIAEVENEREIVFSGGVARMKSIAFALQDKLKKQILIPQNPEIINAIGASLIAQEMDIR